MELFKVEKNTLEIFYVEANTENEARAAIIYNGLKPQHVVFSDPIVKKMKQVKKHAEED